MIWVALFLSQLWCEVPVYTEPIGGAYNLWSSEVNKTVGIDKKEKK